jgi:hypothetical protein
VPSIEYSSGLHRNFHFGLQQGMAIGQVVDAVASFSGDQSDFTGSSGYPVSNL